MPVIHGDRLVAMLDAKKAGHEWRIVGFEQLAPVPAEALRDAVHRLARHAGCTKVSASARLPREVRKAVVGKVAELRENYGHPHHFPPSANRQLELWRGGFGGGGLAIEGKVAEWAAGALA